MVLLKQLVHNTTLLFLSNLFNKATTALLFIFIARQLGPTEAGIFTIGITYSLLLLSPLVGMEDFLIRELVRNQNVTRQYFTNFIAMRVIITLILYLVLMAAFVQFSLYANRTIIIISVIAFTALPEGLFATSQSVFFAHEKFAYPVVISILTMGIKTLGGGIVLITQGDLNQLMLVYFVGSWLGAVLSLAGAIKLAATTDGNWHLNIRFCEKILKSALSFIFMGLLMSLELQIDVILISFLINETEVGWYNGAKTIFITLALLPTAYRIAVFPVMTRLAVESRERLLILYEKSVYYILFFSLPLVAALCLIAPGLLQLLYKEKFDPSTEIVQILIWAIIFLFVNVPNTRLLLVLDLQQWIPFLLLISLFVNIALNLLLIPYFAGIGSAVARIISTGSYTILTFGLIRHHLVDKGTFETFKLIPRIILATIVTGLIIVPIIEIVPLVSVMIMGCSVYIIMTFLTGIIPIDDRKLIQKFIFQKWY